MTSISDDIRSIGTVLGVLVGRVGPEDWSLLRLARANLTALAEQVEGLESGLIPPLPASPVPPNPAHTEESHICTLGAAGSGRGRLQ